MSNRGRPSTTDVGGAYSTNLGHISAKYFIILLPFILSISSPLSAFQGGTGRSGNPYQIANAEQFLRIGSDIELMNKSFILVEDTDLDPNLPGGRVFNTAVVGGTFQSGNDNLSDTAYCQIGAHKVGVFHGRLFGNGHAIRNIVVNAGDGTCVGLFACVGEKAIISDLRIQDACVKGQRHVGLLAGINKGTISYCIVAGSVFSDSRGGGMVGTNLGALTCCGTNTRVTGGSMVGGLVGHSLAESCITHCGIRSRVVGKSKVGGVVGQMLNGTLMGCFAFGSVTSNADAGGLVGTGPLGGTVLKCHSTVHIKGVIVGGLIGVAQETSVVNSKAFGTLAQADPAGPDHKSALGGIVGHWRAGSGSIVSSSWHTTIAPTKAAIGRSAPNAAVNLLSTCGHAPYPRNPWAPFWNRAAICP